MDVIKKEYDVVVIGGGMAGICCALASARHGAHTALVQDRPVLGGNASAEIKMHICGASVGGTKKHVREGGIIEELLMENRKRNHAMSFYEWSTILWEKTSFQDNHDLFLNTTAVDVKASNNFIQEITARQLTTERWLTFRGKIFIDCTGDGFIASQAGARYRLGREGRDEIKEPHAPKKPDEYTMGNTLMFKAVDMKRPVIFNKPFWAYSFTEEQLKGRMHGGEAGFAGYWWIELGGSEELDVIKDGEKIRDELLKVVYGVWNHIKNAGDHKAQNLALDWVQFLPGKRESRRIEGEYMLNENDLISGKVFHDAVAYGGWPMDMHTPEGFRAKGKEPNQCIFLDNIYTIPYRCYYSANVKNLMMAGRNISASHMAFGSTRVMATCAVGGQAVGTAAALAVKMNCLPQKLSSEIELLRQTLLKDDCYIPGCINEDENDLALKGIVSASSWQTGCEPQKVVNGISRQVGECFNGWMSKEIGTEGEWIQISLEKETNTREVHVKFDSDYCEMRNYQVSIDANVRKQYKEGMPDVLVKDFNMELLLDGKVVHVFHQRDNYQRFAKIKVPGSLKADAVRINVFSTYGSQFAIIYEIRVY